MMEDKKPIRRKIVELKVGETASFPVLKMSVVRSTASTVGYELGRKYKTTHDRAHKLIVVERAN